MNRMPTSLVGFVPKDPNTTTRQVWTDNILSVVPPANASDDWKTLVLGQQAVFKALFDHEAMAPNRQQTFMTKAAQKSRVYHLWDFVGRTLQFCYMIPATTSRRTTGQSMPAQVWEDVDQRAEMTAQMVIDSSGKAAKMLDFNIDVTVAFGPEVTEAANNSWPHCTTSPQRRAAMGKALDSGIDDVKDDLEDGEPEMPGLT